MSSRYFSSSRLQQFYSLTNHPTFSESDIQQAVASEKIPAVPKGKKTWPTQLLPKIGEQFGFMRKPIAPLVSSVFVTKGGVLKSSMTLNFARMAALHNIKTCVIGLDMQGDITTSLGFNQQIQDCTNLEDALKKLGEIRGLPDVLFENTDPVSLLQDTDIPTLKFIPETPELVAMEQNLGQQRRREFWLREHVIEPLKQHFDWILLDCPPNWNQLITNALVASDVLISPLECKVNNYRNFKMFQTFVSEFKNDLNLSLPQIFVPTRLTPNRKLSREICEWYQQNLKNCMKSPIKDSTVGEEATAMQLSVPEYQPNSDPAFEMKSTIHEAWKIHLNRINTRTIQQQIGQTSDSNSKAKGEESVFISQ